MATSGTATFSQTSREIITQALYLLHEVQVGETPQPEEAEQARIVLNQMTKTWGAAGRLWLEEEGTVTLLASTASYALASARKVSQVRRHTVSDGSELELTPDSRSDYYARPNKTSNGAPLAWYFDPQRAVKTLYVWPVPDTTIASTMTLTYTYSRVIEDIATLDEDVDVPQEWLEALTYGLARRLGHTTALPVTAPLLWGEIKDQAERLYQALASDDQESSSIFLSPQMCG